MKKTAVKFHIDEDLLAWARRVVARRRCSLSQLVRELMAERREREKREARS